MSHYCDKCHKTMNDNQFYTSYNTEKYPDGLLNTCKRCITLQVDNWDPDTFTPILQEIDVPYIKRWWDEALQKELDKGSKIGPMTILGRYMSKMRLKQYKQYRWKDTEQILAELRERNVKHMREQNFSNEEIDAQLSVDTTPDKPKRLQQQQEAVGTPDYLDPIDEEDEFSQNLTEEDKIYLKLKWGRAYRAEEWVRMEQLYNDMMDSYDIQGAGTKDTLVMICKASLRVNQCMDAGDIDGAQKASKIYDSLMKSANLTAAQNKSDKGEYVDSLGELVAICEEQGFIPKYYIDTPNDMVDKVLTDLQYYTRTLVTEEMNLGNMLDAALKGIQKDIKNEEDLETDDGIDEVIEIDSYQSETPVEEEDYQEFAEMQEELEKENDKVFQSLVEGKV